MRVLVAIPTYRNASTGYVIRSTLKALCDQTLGGFRVLVVYKPSPGDRTLDIVDEYKDKLDIEVRVQQSGFFEEAMNEIFRVSEEYDLTIVTDDDAVPSSRFVEDHVAFHNTHGKVGITSGLVVEKTVWASRASLAAFLAKRVLGVNKPLLENMNDYDVFISNVGLTALKKLYQKHGWEGEYVLTVDIRGVNLSFKSRNYIEGFELKGYTVRGLRNEQLLALHYIRQGLHATRFKGGIVRHVERESLSRTVIPTKSYMIGVELGLLPYGVSLYRFKIDLNKLELLSHVYEVYSRNSRNPRLVGFARGLRLAVAAIKSGLEPREVRSLLAGVEKRYEMPRRNTPGEAYLRPPGWRAARKEGL